MSKQFWAVAYDISDNKVRRKVFRCLEGYGFPMQKSIFILRVSKSAKEKLQKYLLDLDLEPQDLIDFYRLDFLTSYPFRGSNELHRFFCEIRIID